MSDIEQILYPTVLSSLREDTPPVQCIVWKGNEDYEVVLNIWYTGPTGFLISSETFSRLSKICKNLYIICFEKMESTDNL